MNCRACGEPIKSIKPGGHVCRGQLTPRKRGTLAEELGVDVTESEDEIDPLEQIVIDESPKAPSIEWIRSKAEQLLGVMNTNPDIAENWIKAELGAHAADVVAQALAMQRGEPLLDTPAVEVTEADKKQIKGMTDAEHAPLSVHVTATAAAEDPAYSIRQDKVDVIAFRGRRPGLTGRQIERRNGMIREAVPPEDIDSVNREFHSALQTGMESLAAVYAKGPNAEVTDGTIRRLLVLGAIDAWRQTASGSKKADLLKMIERNSGVFERYRARMQAMREAHEKAKAAVRGTKDPIERMTANVAKMK